MTERGDDGSRGPESVQTAALLAGVNLKALGRAELFQLARAIGVENTMVMTRDELIAALETRAKDVSIRLPAPVVPDAGNASGIGQNGGPDKSEAPTGPDKSEATTRVGQLRTHAKGGEALGSSRPAAVHGQRTATSNELTAARQNTSEDGPKAAVAAGPEPNPQPDESGLGSRRLPPGSNRWPLPRAWLAAMLAVLTLALAILGFAWLKYAAFSSDLTRSNTHVPEPVKAALQPVTGAASGPSVVLVEGVTHRFGHPGGSVILIHPDTAAHLATSLTVPSTARVTVGKTAGEVVRRDGTAGLISDLDSVLRVQVNHVLLLDRTELRHIVDSVGAVTFRNPSTVVFAVGGRPYRLAAGSATLNGAQAAAYVRARILDPGLTTWDEREQIILRALTEKLVDVRSLSAVEHLGSVVASSVATDLSAAQVASLVSTRLVTSRIAECTAPTHAVLSATQIRHMVAVFRGTNLPDPAKPVAGCSVRTIGTPLNGTVATGVRLVARHFSAILEAALILVAGLWAATAVLLLASTRRARSFRRRRRGFPRFALATAGAGAASPAPPDSDVIPSGPSAASSNASKHDVVQAPPTRKRGMRPTPSQTREAGSPNDLPRDAVRHSTPESAEPRPAIGAVNSDVAFVGQAAGEPTPDPVPSPRTPGAWDSSRVAPTGDDEPAPPAATPEPTRAAPGDEPLKNAATPSAGAAEATDAARPRLLTRLHCATHGHDPRPHRQRPDAQLVYRCIHCGQVLPPPSS